MVLTFRNSKTSFTVQFEVINLSCNPKITQENRLQWIFFQTCGRTHLQHSSLHDDRGKICSLGTSSLLASGLINVSFIQPIEPTSRHVKKRNVHPWASC